MSKRILMKWTFLCSFIMITMLRVYSQTGNHVPSGAEAANYGTISLITPSGTLWSTARTATPGFFSAVGTATFTGANNANNVNGYVKHYVQAANQGFSFPVGTGTALRTLATSGTIANNTVYATAWIAGDPTTVADPTDASPGTHAITAVGTGITAVSNVGQWDWIVSSGSANGVTVTVTIPDMTAFGAATDLRLVGWNGTQWVNLSGATGASGNNAGSTLAGTMIDGITAIGIGKGAAATDSDGDGVPDATDEDDDNDGISDATEGTGDTDGDGVPDSRDLDSDNDGINDVREAGGTDANGDGKQDGTPNATTGQIGTALTPPNSDNDPLPDYKDLDSDNDAVSDYQEKGGTLGTDADNDGVVDGPDADNDGIPDSVDAFTGFGDVSDPTPVNTDGADTPDYRDPDSDNNGTMDIAQKAGKGALDANNDGQVDNPTDPDSDGIPNNGSPALDSKPTGFGGLALASGPLNGTISAKVFLQGPLNSTGTQMTNTLSTGTTPLIPLTDPYGLNATTTISTLQSNNVTDWVRVELRTTAAATTAPAESIAALLSNDGTLRNADGTTPLRFNTSTGNYYVSIRHRNHLGVMSANTVAISVTPVTVDFTQSTTATYGDGVSTPSQKTVGSVRAMWAGNASGLTSTGIDAIRNSGATGDRTAINNTLIANGSLSGLVSGYLNTDLNLDGVTRNSGASGDGTLLNNIILTHPSNSGSTLTNIFTQNF